MKQLKFRGDRTDTIKPGDIMGPDLHGQHQRVTSVRHEYGYTYVKTTRVTADGQRIRYYGGVDNPEPPTYADDELTDDIEAR